MSAEPTQRYLSFGEWLAFEEQHPNLHHELVEGVVYAMAGATNRHNDIAAAVLAALWRPARDHGCTAVASDQRLKVGLRNGFYPDVAVFCEEPGDGAYRERPCLLVEVVSPSSRQRDFETKAVAYLQIPSLLAYLVVDPERSSVAVHRRSALDQPWQSHSVTVGATIELDCPPVVVAVDDLLT